MAEENIPRILIVTGDDLFALDMSWDKYLARIRAARGECLVEAFDPTKEDERMIDFITRAMTASMFQEVRVFCVLYAQTLSEKELTELGKALDHNLPDVYFFVSAEIEKGGFKGGDKKRKKADKVSAALKIKKRAGEPGVEVYDYSRPRDYEMAGWIEKQAKELFGRTISFSDAQYLAESVDYDFVYSELRKIDQALEQGALIDRKIIDKIVGKTRIRTQYELAAALAKKDLPEALAIIDSIFSDEFKATSVMPAVFRHFWDILKIKKFLDKNPEVLRKYNSKGYGKDSPQSQAAFEIGVAVGMMKESDNKGSAFPKIIKSGIVQQAQRFSEKALREIIKMLGKFEADSRTGKVDVTPLNVQLLCHRIVRAA